MESTFRRSLLVSILLASTACAFPCAAQSAAGQWEGMVVVDKMTIPFRLDITGKANKLQGAFISGDERVTSTRGIQVKDAIELNFDQYAEILPRQYQRGELSGTIEGKFGPGPRSTLPFQAKRYVAQPDPDAGVVPSIGGLWEIEVKSPKGESAWRFIVRQTGADVSATILRVDGDTGASDWRLSRWEIRPQPFFRGTALSDGSGAAARWQPRDHFA